jgi:hypothetical protein
MSTFCCQKKTEAIYKPRKPEKTVLFDVIKKHYKTWCKNLEEQDQNTHFQPFIHLPNGKSKCARYRSSTQIFC